METESFKKPGIRVFILAKPEKIGLTTGRRKVSGTKEYIEIDYGGLKKYQPKSMLKLASSDNSIQSCVSRGEYSGPEELRRILVHTKISGGLSSIYYSMESSQTDFYPHQFKPVLKFLNSPVSRLLIADEVGLGKTIEAIYIWKELQARYQANRLLVVCPAMLRNKWKDDLRQRFGIQSKIVNAKELLSMLGNGRGHKSAGDAFVAIASLEAIRTPANYMDVNNTTTRARVGRLLEEVSSEAGAELFDLVIVDEAHYMRNRSTANHRLGILLRDSARHMLLLTATPIQIHSENLFQLLRIVDPERFVSVDSFDELIKSNSPIISAQRALWAFPAKLAEANSSIKEALTNEYHYKDKILASLSSELSRIVENSEELAAEKRLDMIGSLESRSLLSDYMNRSRKREVFPNRITRRAQSPPIRFSELEAKIYSEVTQAIRARASKTSGMAYFTLIARQRQMASSMVATLRSWNESGYLQETLWEDLGTNSALNEVSDESSSLDSISAELISPELIAKLEKDDSKFSALLEVLDQTSTYDSDGKVVVFAFFRGTLTYLKRRIEKAGYKTFLIMGGMGEEKYMLIDEFKKHPGQAILLSSEVGSEGIDLQFCSSIINYDLPWNPMRVEQRIGRLDRIGQKANTISITNMYHEDSVEERILSRLYARIEVFIDTIGDLEDILGDRVDSLMLKLFDPSLTDDEREELAEQEVLAIENDRQERFRLEEEAINIASFGDYILDQVKKGRERRQWISSEDYFHYVSDFLSGRFPDSNIVRIDSISNESQIELCREARVELETFLHGESSQVRTALHSSIRPVRCIFDPKTTTFPSGYEHIHVSHPLVRWIQYTFKGEVAEERNRLSAVLLPADKNAGLDAGIYVYVVQVWDFSGLVNERCLKAALMPLGDDRGIAGPKAESIIFNASLSGEAYLHADELIEGSSRIAESLQECEAILLTEYESHEAIFHDSNTRRCDQQRVSATGHADRKETSYTETMNGLKEKGHHDMVPLWEGRLRKVRQELEVKLKRINERSNPDAGFSDLCAGVIIVEEQKWEC